MSLLQHIRELLSAKQCLSLNALAKACNTSTEEVETQVCFYLHQGKVRKKNLRLPCKSTCLQCDLSALVLYEWVV